MMRRIFAGRLRLSAATALFVALGLIVLVSVFNVASTLVVLVRERMRDLGALAAITGGAPPVRAAIRVCFWGMLAMGLTTLVGKIFGVAL